MNILFYVSAVVAVLATAMVITRTNAVHALLNMVVSLLAVSLVFLSLGAPFVAAMEVIVYAGAIMVLFVFVVMMLNIGPESSRQEREWLRPGVWVVPGFFSAVLLGELLLFLVSRGGSIPFVPAQTTPAEVGAALYGPYILAVELSGFLLLAGLVGAYHLGRQEDK